MGDQQQISKVSVRNKSYLVKNQPVSVFGNWYKYIMDELSSILEMTRDQSTQKEQDEVWKHIVYSI